jgi:hypothetical protein
LCAVPANSNLVLSHPITANKIANTMSESQTILVVGSKVPFSKSGFAPKGFGAKPDLGKGKVIILLP